MKLENILRFSIVGLFLLWVILTFPDYTPLPYLTSFFVVKFANVFGMTAIEYGRYMIIDLNGINNIFHLSGECAGLLLYAVFVAGTFLIPKFKTKERLVALLFIPVLFFANVLRIFLSVYLAKLVSVDFSLFFHDTIGQVLIFSIGIGSYLGWLKVTGNFKKEVKNGKYKEM